MNNMGSCDVKSVWNFRDLGGYETSAGEIIRSGMVFRSGDLSRLESGDASTITSIGLRTVKYEHVYLYEYALVPELEKGLGECFSFYNHERPHQSLSYQTPAEVHFAGLSCPIAA